MAMIDVGIKIELSEAAVSGGYSSVTTWTELQECESMPALIQPSSKISTDFIGQAHIGEIAGKKAVAGLDFTFAYDGGKTGKQYRTLADYDEAGNTHFLKVTYPDGTEFVLLVNVEVSLVAPTPSGLLTYVVSVTPNLFSDTIGGDTKTKLIKVNYSAT